MPNAERQSEVLGRLERHRNLALENQGHADNEQQTRQLLIDPFVYDVLRYNRADPTDVLTAVDVRHGGPIRKEADYAIKMRIAVDPVDFLLVEAKPVNHPLGKVEIDQLRDYVSGSPTARFGLLTDGVQYLWFKCPPKMRTMDDTPFLSHCVLDESSNRTAEWLAAVSRGSSDLDGLEKLALRLSLEESIFEWLKATLANPGLKEADALNKAARLNVARSELNLVQEAAKSIWFSLQSESPQPPPPPPPPPEIELVVVQDAQVVLADGEVLTPEKTLQRAWRIGTGQWRKTKDASDLVVSVLSQLLGCDLRRNDEERLAQELGLDSFDSRPAGWRYTPIDGFASLYCNTGISNSQKGKLLRRLASKIDIDPSVDTAVTRGARIECWLPTGGRRERKKQG